MTFVLEKVSNIIFLTAQNSDVIFKAWDVDEFTERKRSNAVKKLQSCYIEPIKIIRKFQEVL